MKQNPANSLSQISFWASISMCLLTALTFAIAILTPPLSGPLCEAGCFQYPYTDTASRFPRDFYWMYPALLQILSYLLVLVCLHESAPAEKRIWTRFSLVTSTIAGGILLLTYFIQLSVIQPSLLKGEFDGLALWSQYNPHGLFIALEEIGYLIMSLSLFCLVPVFNLKSGLDKALRWTFLSNFTACVASLILISFLYGIHREYRFELAVISFNWLALILSGILLALRFRP